MASVTTSCSPQAPPALNTLTILILQLHQRKNRYNHKNQNKLSISVSDFLSETRIHQEGSGSADKTIVLRGHRYPSPHKSRTSRSSSPLSVRHEGIQFLIVLLGNLELRNA